MSKNGGTKAKANTREVVLFILLAVALLVILVFVTKPLWSQLQEDKKYKDLITDAADKLVSNESYLISSSFEEPTDTTFFIEWVNNGDSYTEYSYEESEDGEAVFGKTEFGQSEDTEYVRTDWLTKEGDAYCFVGDTTYKYPSSYTPYIDDRNAMYINDLVKAGENFEQGEDFTFAIGEEQLNCKTYTFEVPSDVVESVVGVNTYGLYEAVAKDCGSGDEAVKDLMKSYLKDLEMPMTCSDGIISVGIDQNGVLRYMSLECGGIGSKLYYTKVVVELNQIEVDSRPDFTGALSFKDSFKTTN